MRTRAVVPSAKASTAVTGVAKSVTTRRRSSSGGSAVLKKTQLDATAHLLDVHVGARIAQDQGDETFPLGATGEVDLLDAPPAGGRLRRHLRDEPRGGALGGRHRRRRPHLEEEAISLDPPAVVGGPLQVEDEARPLAGGHHHRRAGVFEGEVEFLLVEAADRAVEVEHQSRGHLEGEGFGLGRRRRKVEGHLEAVPGQGGELDVLQHHRGGRRRHRPQAQEEAQADASLADDLRALHVWLSGFPCSPLSVRVRGRSIQPPRPSGTTSTTSTRVGAMATIRPWFLPR
ncbi:MAG: hypothetical protein KatS3mg124_0506 [Porticoccaceae bacterium]|nr:MAG: hypothetical protein KatS3mg124_0506 [Porticoccaceae bacterium]